ncbi:MAG: hypothetical protein AABX55_01085, partial [Nanoarchaeota archaeon]
MGIKIGFSKNPEIRAQQLKSYRIQEENKQFLEQIKAQLNLLQTKIPTALQNRIITLKEKKEILSLI